MKDRCQVSGLPAGAGVRCQEKKAPPKDKGHGDGGPPPFSPAEGAPGILKSEILDLRSPTCRRDFFRTLPRLVLLGGLAALTGVLAGRKGKPARPGDVCSHKGVCNGCAAFKGCGLPLALSVRAQRKEADHG